MDCWTADLTGLEASSNGTLMRRDTRTGEVMWDLQLPAAALAAFTGSGAEISLNLPASNPEPGPRTALALPEGGDMRLRLLPSLGNLPVLSPAELLEAITCNLHKEMSLCCACREE